MREKNKERGIEEKGESGSEGGRGRGRSMGNILRKEGKKIHFKIINRGCGKVGSELEFDR